MIIGIDVREGARSERAGKGEYVYQLVTHLITHAEQRWVLFSDTDLPVEWQQPQIKRVVIKTSAWLWQLRVFWYLEILRPVDVYFSPTSLILPAVVRSIPVVTALMDFVSFLFPGRHDLKAVILEKWWMRPALRYSRNLLAISEHTKQDAVRLFGTRPDKIIVTPLAASFGQKEETYPLPARPTILCVGTLEPRKNIERVIAAFNLIKPQVLEAQLTLVGRWGWQSDGIRQAIAESPYKDDIKVLEHISNAQKKSIYQQATVLVFPSLYEGFGLPPLEAMSVGLPVVVSERASLPEVVGEAGLMVDPLSVPSIAAAILKVLQHPEVAANLRRLGLARARLFSWDKTAAETLKVLQDSER